MKGVVVKYFSCRRMRMRRRETMERNKAEDGEDLQKWPCFVFDGEDRTQLSLRSLREQEKGGESFQAAER